MRRGRRPESRAARQARQEFTETVLAAGRCELQDLFPHVCDGWADACHVLPKSWIRREINTWDEPERLAALWSPANGLAGCRAAHNRFDAPGHAGVTFADLPLAAVAFAEKHGWTWKLERIYGVAALAVGEEGEQHGE